MSDERCEELFEAMVDSVGVKAFAADVGLSTRQVYRILNGVQPNPIERLCRALDACEEGPARQAIDHICQEQDGYFVPVPEDLAEANVNAVKEAAEAIVAISEGEETDITVKEIREAIAALAGLERILEAEAGSPRRP